MNKPTVNIEQIRTETSKLHQQLDEALAKNEAAMRKASADAVAKAQELATKLRTTAQAHHSEASARFAEAATSFESAAASAKKTMDAKGADLRERNLETLHHIRAAAQNLSQAIAAKAPREKQRV